MGRRGNERGAFLSSCVYLASMLVGAAAAMYPNLLVSTTNPALNITVVNAHSGLHALEIGLIWWGIGMAMAIGYFVFVYRTFRGKLTAGLSAHHE
jgi:cytochrome d ubiquinol oxidase subunit II